LGYGGLGYGGLGYGGLGYGGAGLSDPKLEGPGPEQGYGTEQDQGSRARSMGGRARLI